MPKSDVVLIANSPGELSALVKPVSEEFARDKSTRLILVLTPCQYTSGKELDYAKSLPGIGEIISAAEYKRWVFFNQRPKQVKFNERGAVLFLGGDLTHAVLIARKLRFPAYAYLQERIAWKGFYKKFFVPDMTTYHKFHPRAPKGKLKLVGNLMVDSVAEFKKWDPQENIITFMPGSRRWEVDYMTPLYAQVIELIKKELPKAKFQLVSSPFIKARPILGVKTIEFKNIYNSELMVTIPGTNTAKIAALGIPMVVVFPLNHPEVIPLEGLADWIGKIPLMGRAFKKWLANVINHKTKYFALPNQKAGREIVPEIRGVIDPLGVALKVLLLLNDKKKREEMSAGLVEAMGKAGAAQKIFEEIHVAA
jgi:lipid-A-disaccharide synthase